jgi:anti-sigma factor RsiW
MTSEEARARFDAAIDAELSESERVAFERALADDPAVHAEFERHRAIVEQARTVGRAVATVDLLGGVQDKLRARSGGRFYRDRFAEQRTGAGLSLMISTSAVLVLLVLAWLLYDAGMFAP